MFFLKKNVQLLYDTHMFLYRDKSSDTYWFSPVSASQKPSYRQGEYRT